jgi:Tfp pilus assembly protein PilX
MARHCPNVRRLVDDRKGMAVVVALLILVMLSLLGITLMSLSMTESQIGANESDLKKAFFAAEAGIQEAMYRMRLDPNALSYEGASPGVPCTATADPTVVGFVQGGVLTIPNPDPGHANFWKYNPFTTPTACSWTYSGSNAAGYGNYFGGTAANLDSAGRTFKSSGAAHTTGALINASLTNTLSDPRAYTVTVTSLIGHNGTCWQYVDQFGVQLKPCPFDPINPPSDPLFKVTSIGTAKSSQKTLVTIIQRPNIKGPKGTLEANTNINVQSASAIIDGRNYDCNGNNPAADGNFPAATSPTGTGGISINKPANVQCDNGTGLTNCGGTSGTFPDTIGALLVLGTNPPAPTQNQINQINALNAYLESIKIDPVAHPELVPSSAFHGFLYVDGNYAKPPDGSTGILIVHHRDASNHDIATLGNFNEGTFKGLIIADKINKINGSAEIIGGIFGFGNAADGIAVDDVTGTPNIKYSKCAIDTFAPPTLFPYQVVLGTWHEQ